jgi:hypothetical protein
MAAPLAEYVDQGQSCQLRQEIAIRRFSATVIIVIARAALVCVGRAHVHSETVRLGYYRSTENSRKRA